MDKGPANNGATNMVVSKAAISGVSSGMRASAVIKGSSLIIGTDLSSPQASASPPNNNADQGASVVTGGAVISHPRLDRILSISRRDAIGSHHSRTESIAEEK